MAKVFDMAKSWINDILYNHPAPVETKPAESPPTAETAMSSLAKVWQAKIVKAAEDKLYGQATGNLGLPSWALPSFNPHPAQAAYMGIDPATAAPSHSAYGYGRSLTPEEIEESRRRIDGMMQNAMLNTAGYQNEWSGGLKTPSSPWEAVGRAAAQAESNPEKFAKRTMAGKRVTHAQYEEALRMRDRAEAIIARYDAENDPAFDGMYEEALPTDPPSLRFVPGKMLEQINQLSVVHGITSLVVTRKVFAAIIDEMNDRSVVWSSGDVPGRSIRMYGVSIGWM